MIVDVTAQVDAFVGLMVSTEGEAEPDDEDVREALSMVLRDPVFHWTLNAWHIEKGD